MTAILNKYAIKEIADVMFYELDKYGAPSAPVLYLDTLKVSTINQSSEIVDARGGKGNVKLLSWDTNKEITLELEDAVFSAKSLAIMFGGTIKENGNTQEVLKTLRAADINASTKTGETDYCIFSLKGQDYYIAKNRITTFVYSGTDGIPTAVETPNWTSKNFDFATFDLLDCTKEAGTATVGSNTIIKDGVTINVTAEFDSNTYYITGDTYARNVASGQDEFLQFIIPKGKVSAEDVSITMEADGDPATFSMTVQCLKAEDDSMLKFVKYSLDSTQSSSGDKNKGVASVLDQYNNAGEHAPWDNPKSVVSASNNQGEPSNTTE